MTRAQISVRFMVLLTTLVSVSDAVYAQDDAPIEAAPVIPPELAPTEPLQCVPQCRSGYMCLEGQCVSRCNPVCAPGEECLDGECFAPGLSEQPRAEGAETHDGFMARFAVGLGYSRAASGQRVDDGLVLSGVSDSFSFDIGAALDENWTVHARFSGFSTLDPGLEVNGEVLIQYDGIVLASYLFGPALTYNIMPANIYLTAALGMSWLTQDTEQSETYGSDVGFGANLDLGKEWWVSDNWGLGVSGRLWFANISDSQPLGEVTYNMFGGAALFSATYN